MYFKTSDSDGEDKLVTFNGKGIYSSAEFTWNHSGGPSAVICMFSIYEWEPFSGLVKIHNSLEISLPMANIEMIIDTFRFLQCLIFFFFMNVF
jgi:hypothetical protein